MKRIGRIAPGTAQIAPRKPHKNARQTRVAAFALNGSEYFRYLHESAAAFLILTPERSQNADQCPAKKNRRPQKRSHTKVESKAQKDGDINLAHGHSGAYYD